MGHFHIAIPADGRPHTGEQSASGTMHNFAIEESSAVAKHRDALNDYLEQSRDDLKRELVQAIDGAAFV